MTAILTRFTFLVAMAGPRDASAPKRSHWRWLSTGGNNMRPLLLVALCLGVAFGTAVVPANADNTVIVVQPNPYAQQFADNIKRSQDAMSQAGQGLGQLLGNAAQGKQITALSVITKCGHYHLIEVFYRDGSICH
jgi:hypothetical protein